MNENNNYDWNKDLTNIACTESYLNEFKNFCSEVFTDGTLSDERTFDAGSGYTAYVKHITDIRIKTASEWELFNPNGESIFRYSATDCTLHKITEIDGRLYFIYNDNLYGYNVLRLDDMKEYRYFPKASFKDSFAETFIWTDIFYNPNNRLLAVYGCYWACPYEVMLYRVPDIMKPFTEICYPTEFLACDYYDTANDNAVSWEENELVINYFEKYCDGEEYPSGQFRIPEAEYQSRMHTVKI